MSRRAIQGKPLAAALAMALLAACGEERDAPEAGADDGGGGGAASVASEPAANVVPEKVASCAGFTAAAAAAVLGVSASEVEDSSSDLHETLRMCGYTSTVAPYGAVSFSLSIEPSAEEAAAEMAQLRENVDLAQGSIDAVTGSPTEGAAVTDITGLGDEAIWTRVNGALNVRWRNVMIQVMSPSERELQLEVAREVVGGLQ